MRVKTKTLGLVSAIVIGLVGVATILPLMVSLLTTGKPQAGIVLNRSAVPVVDEQEREIMRRVVSKLDQLAHPVVGTQGTIHWEAFQPVRHP
ncbi:MAG: hypothetical protein HQL93_06030 [Magnetococcales bacterium]|nr:hypothetical protein [Magnetococcales bacterium]